LLRPAGGVSGSARDVASRVRDAIAIGVAIPLVLAAVGLLYPIACAGVLAGLAIVRTIVRRPWPLLRAAASSATPPLGATVSRVAGIALPVVAAIAVSWPQLVRPLQQGDSLGYHLPNAAAWSDAHSLWTTGTWYWWYPGGSEMFAAGIFCVAGPLAVGLAGFVVLLLLALRLFAFGRRAGLSPLAGGAISAATITIPTIALQGGSLENDVWLAAFLLEVVWALLEERAALGRTLAVTSIIKPYGWMFGALAALVGRGRLRDVALGFVPMVLWVVRDAILWKSATIDPRALAVPHLWDTTIVAHGATGIVTLVLAIVQAGPGMVIAGIALVAAIAFSREPLVRWTALGAFVFFLIEPFGFQNDLPQLATGASLRFAIPSLVLAVVGVLSLLRRVENVATIVCLALAAYQVSHVVAIFHADTITYGWPWVAALLGVAIVVDVVWTRGVLTGFAALALIAYGVVLASSHPADYYDDGLMHDGHSSHFFAWLAKERPSAVVGDHILLGSIAVISPETRVQNTVSADTCADAERASALLVVADDPASTDSAFEARRSSARACGKVLYDDGVALVVAPTPSVGTDYFDSRSKSSNESGGTPRFKRLAKIAYASSRAPRARSVFSSFIHP